MDREGRLELLAQAARYDVCLSSCAANTAGGVGRYRDPPAAGAKWGYPVATPRNGPVGVIKVLQTSVCKNNCRYCVFAACRDGVRRATMAPDELASTFAGMYRAGGPHGLFLSSGVRGSPDLSMTRMVETARVLRTRHAFRGYLHLKILPGTSRDLVREAARWATRLSVNLEASGPRALRDLAPDKDFVADLLLRMKWAGESIREGLGATSQSTQFVVGATPESDLDLLRTVDWIYREMYVFRAYFSAYQPPDSQVGPAALAADVRSATVPRGRPREEGAARLDREHRLYQADYLLRGYGFRLRDLVFDAGGNLPTGVDPKTAYAMANPARYPVDVSRASLEDLLRVPGVGPRTARVIVDARSRGAIRGFEDLARLGRVARRASPYLLFQGRADPDRRAAWRQLELQLGDARALGWAWGHEPLAPERLTGESYAYPGQTGRRLHYDRGPAGEVARCR